MDWQDMLFGGGQASAGAAMYNELNQGLQGSQGLYNQGMGYLSPFMQREPGLYQQYMDTLGQSKNPMDLYNQFANSYKMSPEAQAQIQVGQKNANNAATASGMLGSGAAQTAAAGLAQSVRSQDFDKYMQNMFGIRDQYLGGLGGMQKEGFQAGMQGSNLAEQQAALEQRYYENMANARAGQEEGESKGWTNMLGQGIGLAASFF